MRKITIGLVKNATLCVLCLISISLSKQTNAIEEYSEFPGDFHSFVDQGTKLVTNYRPFNEYQIPKPKQPLVDGDKFRTWQLWDIKSQSLIAEYTGWGFNMDFLAQGNLAQGYKQADVLKMFNSPTKESLSGLTEVVIQLHYDKGQAVKTNSDNEILVAQVINPRNGNMISELTMPKTFDYWADVDWANADRNRQNQLSIKTSITGSYVIGNLYRKGFSQLLVWDVRTGRIIASKKLRLNSLANSDKLKGNSGVVQLQTDVEFLYDDNFLIFEIHNRSLVPYTTTYLVLDLQNSGRVVFESKESDSIKVSDNRKKVLITKRDLLQVLDVKEGNVATSPRIQNSWPSYEEQHFENKAVLTSLFLDDENILFFGGGNDYRVWNTKTNLIEKISDRNDVVIQTDTFSEQYLTSRYFQKTPSGRYTGVLVKDMAWRKNDEVSSYNPRNYTLSTYDSVSRKISKVHHRGTEIGSWLLSDDFWILESLNNDYSLRNDHSDIIVYSLESGKKLIKFTSEEVESLNASSDKGLLALRHRDSLSLYNLRALNSSSSKRDDSDKGSKKNSTSEIARQIRGISEARKFRDLVSSICFELNTIDADLDTTVAFRIEQDLLDYNKITKRIDGYEKRLGNFLNKNHERLICPEIWPHYRAQHFYSRVIDLNMMEHIFFNFLLRPEYSIDVNIIEVADGEEQTMLDYIRKVKSTKLYLASGRFKSRVNFLERILVKEFSALTASELSSTN